MMSTEIDCPDDTMTYTCGIKSNTEDLHLLWSIAFPDVHTFEMIYDENSPYGSEDILEMNTTTNLVQYDSMDGYIESTLTITVLNVNVSMNGTTVDCSIADLGKESVTITINTSGMCTMKLYVQ